MPVIFLCISCALLRLLQWWKVFEDSLIRHRIGNVFWIWLKCFGILLVEEEDRNLGELLHKKEDNSVVGLRWIAAVEARVFDVILEAFYHGVHDFN